MWVRSACLRYHDQPVPRADLTLTFRGLCQVSESDGIVPVEANKLCCYLGWIKVPAVHRVTFM